MRASEREASQERQDWWRRGWLVDDGSADWEPVDDAPRPEARAMAERYRGCLVRLRSVPEGYESILRCEGPARTAIDPGPHGVPSVLSRGWPGGPQPPDGSVLIGPVSFLVGALRRGADRPVAVS
jgi:hypothetical protein